MSWLRAKSNILAGITSHMRGNIYSHTSAYMAFGVIIICFSIYVSGEWEVVQKVYKLDHTAGGSWTLNLGQNDSLSFLTRYPQNLHPNIVNWVVWSELYVMYHVRFVMCIVEWNSLQCNDFLPQPSKTYLNPETLRGL